MADLQKVAGISATIVEPPLDVSTGASIQGKLDANPLATSEARFTIRVSRSSGPRA